MVKFPEKSIASDFAGLHLLTTEQQLRVRRIEMRSQRLSEPRRRRINSRYARLAVKAIDDISAHTLDEVIAAYGNMVEVALRLEQRTQRRKGPHQR